MSLRKRLENRRSDLVPALKVDITFLNILSEKNVINTEFREKLVSFQLSISVSLLTSTRSGLKTVH
jgi:hypothetical protein